MANLGQRQANRIRKQVDDVVCEISHGLDLQSSKDTPNTPVLCAERCLTDKAARSGAAYNGLFSQPLHALPVLIGLTLKSCASFRCGVRGDLLSET